MRICKVVSRICEAVSRRMESGEIYAPTGVRNPLAERNEQYAIERWQTMHNRWWNEVKPAE